MANPSWFDAQMLAPEVLQQLQAKPVPVPSTQGPPPMASPRPVTAEQFMDTMARQGMSYEDARFQLRLKQAELEGQQQDTAQQQGLASWQAAMDQARASMPPVTTPTQPTAQPGQGIPSATGPPPPNADDQYARQGQAFAEAFKAGVPPAQFNVSDATTLADYAEAKQAEQAAANAGATPEFLRQMHQGVWFGSSGPDTGDRTKREAAQARRTDVLAERRENLRRARLRPDLRAQELMDEENKVQQQQFKTQVSAEKQVALGTVIASLSNIEGMTPFAVEQMVPKIAKAMGVPIPGASNGPPPTPPVAPGSERSLTLTETATAAGVDTNLWLDEQVGDASVGDWMKRMWDVQGFGSMMNKENTDVLRTFMAKHRPAEWKQWQDGDPNVWVNRTGTNPKNVQNLNHMRKMLGLPPITLGQYRDRIDWLNQGQGLIIGGPDDDWTGMK